MTFEQLRDVYRFTRADYYMAKMNSEGFRSEDALSYALRKDVEDGTIIHIGRNQYAFPKEKRAYNHEYSDVAKEVASVIKKEFPEVDFRVFELIQMNKFVGHQFSHNTILVYVENAVLNYVFDSLKQKYPGRTLLKPKIDEYFRYVLDNEIVVLRLPSESPKGKQETWHSCLEKILVDISLDKFLSNIISEGEYTTVFDEAFHRYFIDVKAMLRYSRRKGADTKYRDFLMKYAPYILEESA